MWVIRKRTEDWAWDLTPRESCSPLEPRDPTFLGVLCRGQGVGEPVTAGFGGMGWDSVSGVKLSDAKEAAGGTAWSLLLSRGLLTDTLHALLQHLDLLEQGCVRITFCDSHQGLRITFCFCCP